LSFKEPIDKIRKRVEELVTGVQETTQSIRELIRASRPKPFKTFISKKIDELRPLQRLRKRVEEEG